MSEEEKNHTTGIEDTSPENGMGGVSENSVGVSPEEPPKRKRGRPRKVPGDPKNKPMTVGEYIAMHPGIAEQVSLNSYGTGTQYPADFTADETVAREMDRHFETMALPRVNTHSYEEIQGRFIEYIQLCRKYGKRLTVGGFAECLGISKGTLWNIATGQVRRPPEVVETINAALTTIAAELEDMMVAGKINPVSGIFLLKQMGYRDNVDLTIKSDARVEKSEEELAAEYLDSIPTVDD